MEKLIEIQGNIVELKEGQQVIMTQLVSLEAGQNELRQEFSGFRMDTNAWLEALESEVRGMRGDFNNAFSRNNELLEMLVANTRRQ